MEFDEYESLPKASMSTVMMAGALAGASEHSVMYPLDSIKTRMQSFNPVPGGKYTGISDVFRRMLSEGLLRPMRGFSTVLLGAGPAHALYFSCYEKLKDISLPLVSKNHQYIVHGSAGVFATLLHDGIMTPADLVKQRMQMHGSPYSSTWDCVRKTFKAEGSRAFYRSYTTQATMNVPFQSIHFIIYEFMQKVTNKKKKYKPSAHVVSGGVAGAIAAAVTTPFDVCKTFLNTQDRSALMGKPFVSGLIKAAKSVYMLGGLKGFFQGMSARVLYQIPATAISWSVYEFFKYFINKHEIELQRKAENFIETVEDLSVDIKTVKEKY